METTPPIFPERTHLLSPREVALRLRISRAMAYKLLTAREIPSIRIGRAVRVREKDLEAYISRGLSMD